MDKKIVRYNLITAETKSDERYWQRIDFLNNELNEMIEESWEPFGSLQVTKHSMNDGSIVFRYYQPMVKYED